ncbi:metal-dependent transcriptional regulator [Halapricum desulfuricans]|uniref:Mn-dependent transcriptional regulator (DtxR family) n=1 Tax=Halapricum desulfuricans TaxID=2841257 RepID=A0A897NDW6_9EURY|nr:metal-dependent transcriptional regulator [Halapricum desulfuricans]QSG09129.1 Mn-dependent transcriptional regulator (DtxR family) [Halapricum desulfuricans]
MLSPEMEDYLKAIHEHQRETTGPVSTSTIAESMDVTPPTATSMMEKLEERGLVEREKYKGVRLTDEGETIATEVIRHHRLLETYLTDKLGFDWAAVHEEADRLEHHISEEFERRVAAQLDDPDVDPHGDPIPSDALEPLEECSGTALSECGEGDTVEVTRVRDRDPDELEYLSEVGIEPGTTLAVVDTPPIGLIEVELESETRVSLPEHVAATIRVTGATSATND